MTILALYNYLQQTIIVILRLQLKVESLALHLKPNIKRYYLLLIISYSEIYFNSFLSVFGDVSL